MEEERDSSQNKVWHSYISEDLPRTVQQSTYSAIRSARSIQNTSSTHLRTLQVPPILQQNSTHSTTQNELKSHLFVFLCNKI